MGYWKNTSTYLIRGEKMKTELIHLFVEGFAKMNFIWIAILFGLVGTSISERRDKHARLEAQRACRRG